MAAEPLWRDLLRRRVTHAANGYSEAQDAACLAALQETGLALGQARAALSLVDHFAAGWRATGGPPAKGEDFSAQFEMLFQGIAATMPAPNPRRDRRLIFQRRLWILLRTVRESAALAYADEDTLNELDRRIILLLASQGDTPLSQASKMIGIDKAQVSRAVKRLEEAGFIARPGVRSPLHLAASARDRINRLVRIALLRDRELTFDLGEDALATYFDVVESLIARARLQFDQERELANSPAGAPIVAAEGASSRCGIRIDRSRVLPPLSTLTSYIVRSGALLYKRVTPLSNFETWVLSSIECNAPMEWARLVETVNRDESQANRTLRRLSELGLIEREGPPGRRNGIFRLTEDGARLHRLIEDTGADRSDFLLHDIPPQRLRSFFATFDTIAYNARAQLARENARAELGGP